MGRTPYCARESCTPWLPQRWNGTGSPHLAEEVSLFSGTVHPSVLGCPDTGSTSTAHPDTGCRLWFAVFLRLGMPRFRLPGQSWDSSPLQRAERAMVFSVVIALWAGCHAPPVYSPGLLFLRRLTARFGYSGGIRFPHKVNQVCPASAGNRISPTNSSLAGVTVDGFIYSKFFIMHLSSFSFNAASTFCRRVWSIPPVQCRRHYRQPW